MKQGNPAQCLYREGRKQNLHRLSTQWIVAVIIIIRTNKIWWVTCPSSGFKATRISDLNSLAPGRISKNGEAQTLWGFCTPGPSLFPGGRKHLLPFRRSSRPRAWTCPSSTGASCNSPEAQCRPSQGQRAATGPRSIRGAESRAQRMPLGAASFTSWPCFPPDWPHSRASPDEECLPERWALSRSPRAQVHRERVSFPWEVSHSLEADSQRTPGSSPPQSSHSA